MITPESIWAGAIVAAVAAILIATAVTMVLKASAVPEG